MSMLKISSKRVYDFHIRLSKDRSQLIVEWCNPPSGVRKLPPRITEFPSTIDFKNPRDLGRALYDVLFFDKEVRDCFLGQYRRICVDGGNGEILRLTLDFSLDPGKYNVIVNFPWELLHDGGDWLLSSPKFSVVRRFNTKLPQSEDKSKIELPIRILLAYSEPQDKNPINNAEENLEKILKVIEHAVKIAKIEVIPHATAEKLMNAVNRGFHVIHLLGHGDQGVFYLEEDEVPVSGILTGTALQQEIHKSKIKPRLVVLMACHSGNSGVFGVLGLASKIFDVGVEAVLSMQTALYTDESRVFTETFYKFLFESRSIDLAVCMARQELRKIYDPDNKTTHVICIGESKGNSSIRQHPMKFVTSPDIDSITILSIPNWSVPALSLQGDGFLNLEIPLSLNWSKDKKEMIYVEEGCFYMDKYPVTRGEYRTFAMATNRPIPDWKRIDDVSLREFAERHKLDVTDKARESWEDNLPATNITFMDALAYAAWAGKHIPTPHEWQQAALSGCENKNAPYPWGSNLSERVANTGERRSRQLWPVFFSERFRNCSDAGVCDIVGNVAEWTRDEDGRTYVCGGSFKDWGEMCTVHTCRPVPDGLSRESIGFRCAANLDEWLRLKNG